MLPILLTKHQGAFLGPIANILGYLMSGIFNFLDLLKIPNTGLSIILFTVVIYLAMLPLTIKQQKFSKLNAKMSPELQAVQARYKGKKDNVSMQAMNEETQAIYAKYGVSPTGSCLPLIVQMPILFALYRVINNMPAYVSKIREAFYPLVNNLIGQAGSSEFIRQFKNATMYNRQFDNESFISGVTEYVQNTYIDVLHMASTTELTSIIEKYPTLAQDVNKTIELLGRYNNFLGINIGNSPSFMASEALSTRNYFALVIAFIIPVLSAVTQWVNVKLMPQQAPASPNGGDQANSMAQSMKMMNMMMPLMSAFFCYTLPAGMGLYWVAGAIVRSIQQVIINKHIDKIDLDELIKKNVAKRNKKLAKSGIDPSKINTYASLNTRKVNNSLPQATLKAAEANTGTVKTAEEKEAAIKKSTEYYNKNAKTGSIASKVNMVKQFNEKNNK